ncbi:MAG: hypothetical protein EOP49_46025 [Sphingobacteriales bacterium]|nr:MAG: hypothetical protein EOP49_46025 [Sphingobacteriales bacterium]
MKKLIGALGLVALFTVGVTENASAQFGGINQGQRQVSSRAKGAIIGGGLGAAAGAIIHRRDPVGGGIVGAVLGAGAGYVIGNSEDKAKARRVYQNSRYQRQSYYRGGQRNYQRQGYYRR